MPSNFISTALNNKPEGVRAMGYSYDIKKPISYLQQAAEYGDSATSATAASASGSILGLGSTQSSSVDIKRFSGQFSETEGELLWKVELGYTQVLPLKKNTTNTYFLSLIKGAIVCNSACIVCGVSSVSNLKEL